MMHWFYGDAWMTVWWVLVAGLIAAVIWALTRSGRPPAGSAEPREPGESAEEILKRRYARGEIDRETFQRTLSDLKSAH